MLDISKINSENRTKNIKNQIYISFILKGLSIFLSFYVVKLSLDNLGSEMYGIWIILLSFLSWITLFDVGIGNGLRNKLTIALSNNKITEAKSLISTAYFSIFFIAVCFFIPMLIGIFHINWPDFFNSNILERYEYQKIMIIFLCGISITFCLGLINSILSSFQQPALTNLISILTNLFFIGFLLTHKYISWSILQMVIYYTLSIILAHLFVTCYFFSKVKYLLPRYKYYSFSMVKDIIYLGGSFFIIQISALFIFTTDNFIILRLLGTESVAKYSIIYKLYSTFTIAFGLILSPMWSAFTEANQKGDFKWMTKSVRKLNQLMIIVILGLLFISVYNNYILEVWLNDKNIPNPELLLIVSFCVFIFISIWNNIYSFLLNGLGIVKMQKITAVSGAVLNIPLSICLITIFNLGLSGVVLSMSICLLPFSILGPISVYNYLKNSSSD